MAAQHEALRTWLNLNDFLMGVDDESALKKLLGLELTGKKRRQFALRIHSRLCHVRRQAELESIKSAAPPQRVGRRTK